LKAFDDEYYSFEIHVKLEKLKRIDAMRMFRNGSYIKKKEKNIYTQFDGHRLEDDRQNFGGLKASDRYLFENIEQM
jgi:hypothetical protein